MKHGDRFLAALAYVKAQDEAGKIKQSKEGFFRKSLEENWNLVVPLKSFVVVDRLDSNSGIDEPTDVEMALIDEAISSGKAMDKYYGSKQFKIRSFKIQAFIPHVAHPGA